jgi:hypothetical protein
VNDLYPSRRPFWGLLRMRSIEAILMVRSVAKRRVSNHRISGAPIC